MKRLTGFAAVLLALTMASVGLAATGGLGKFETKLTGTGANTRHGMLDGTWKIDLSSPTSGRVGLTWNGEQTGGGKYVISGSTITLTPKKGGNCHGKGKYTLKHTGDKLTFTPIHDTCAVRRAVLTFGAWTAVS